MFFVAKSAPDSRAIIDKRDKGFNNIEIQLIKLGISNEFNIITSVENIDIVGIHTPLVKEDGISRDIDIALITNNHYRNILKDTCELAEQLANYYNKRIYVVLHNSLCKDNIDNMCVLTNKIIEIFKELCNTYKNIDFYIENVSPLSFDDRFRNGVYIEDISYLVDLLNKSCGKRFGITYDTCHNMITEQYYNRLIHNNEKVNTDGYKFKMFSNDYIFRNFGHNIKNIHLNNIIRCGSAPKTHGTPFLNCDKDKNYLKEFF